MKMTKRILALALVVLMLATCFVGCGESSGGAGVNSGEKVTLKISYFKGGYGEEWLKAITEAYTAKHPNVTFQLEGDPDMTLKIGTRLESGANLPGMFADYMLLGKPIDLDVAVKEFRKPFISEKIMVEEYVNGYITAEERKAHFEKCDIHFVYDDVDKAAYRHFKKFYPAAKLMRTAFRLKNGSAE